MKKIIYPEDPDYEDYKGIYDECEYCHTLVNFDSLDEEDIIMQHEGMVDYCGFEVATPDSIAGFICPERGGKNEF